MRVSVRFEEGELNVIHKVNRLHQQEISRNPYNTTKLRWNNGIRGQEECKMDR